EHEWVRTLPDGELQVGITAFAQRALGDVVFVTLPELGAPLAVGDVCGEVESTKSVSDLFCPASGTVMSVNADLQDHPELINTDPYGLGWLFQLQAASPPMGLLTPDEYRVHTE
ncbi:MAG: glycine cleavage system protein GcvH, partial [Angustibacter sp.]